MNKRKNLNIRQINIVNASPPAQDLQKSEERNYELLREDFKSKQDTVDESTTMIENRTFEIASGGLALSITVLSFF